jgi:hypothetical protein
MIYIYQREDGTRFEYSQSMKDEPLKVCPETQLKVRRVITGGRGVQFKGEFPGKIVASETRHQKALAEDPLYTTLSDYKPKVDEFNDKHERLVKRKIMVTT